MNKVWHVLLNAFIILIFLAVIAGIGFAVTYGIRNEGNRITEGTVVDKDFSPGYTYAGSDKTGFYARSIEPSYMLKIHGEKDGETVEYWFECTAEEYASYSIGDYFKR